MGGGEEGGETLTLSAPSAPPPQGGGHPQESGAVGAEPPGWQLGAHNRLSRASRDSSLECSCRVAKSCFLPPPSSPPFPGSRVAPEGAGGLVARKHPCLPSPGLWSWCQAERGAEDFASPVRRMGTRGYPVGREGMSPTHALLLGCPMVPASWPFWPSTGCQSGLPAPPPRPCPVASELEPRAKFPSLYLGGKVCHPGRECKRSLWHGEGGSRCGCQQGCLWGLGKASLASGRAPEPA